LPFLTKKGIFTLELEYKDSDHPSGGIMPEKSHSSAPRRVYIDYNATTPLRPEVKAAMIADLDVYGNASSMHASGRLARARVEEARARVARLIGAQAAEIIFTSGGSESNNTVFQTMRRLASNADGSPLKTGRNEFITTVIEHPCVLNSASYLKELGFTAHFLPVDADGKIDLADLEKALNGNTLFVSVMMANNEIGTLQDIKEISRPYFSRSSAARAAAAPKPRIPMVL
jgi:cysteine desulfurase